MGAGTDVQDLHDLVPLNRSTALRHSPSRTMPDCRIGVKFVWLAAQGRSPARGNGHAGDNDGVSASRDAEYDHARHVAIAVQLGLLIALIYKFDLVNASFHDLCILIFFGFLVHASLPRHLRLHCFLALSLAGIVLVLGADGLWLVGLASPDRNLPPSGPVRSRGCPAPQWPASARAAPRHQAWSLPWPSAIWPILASMFMFRLIVYLYDLRYGNAPRHRSRTASYFFMLPERLLPVCSPWSITSVRRNYYDEDDGRIYQTGVDWMFAGCAT